MNQFRDGPNANFLGRVHKVQNVREIVDSMRTGTRVNILLFMSGALLLASTFTLITEADAQVPSLFPPPPSGSEGGGATGKDNLTVPTDDKSPPEIEWVTSELKQGKNVLVVKVNDESFLSSRQVKYVGDGRVKLADLARDHDNVYHALIDVNPPSSTLVIDISDVAGNRATVTKELPVVSGSGPSDLLDRLVDVWRNILAFIGIG